MYYKLEDVERRCLPMSEVNLRVDGEDAPKIVGYAAVFNTWADIGGWFRESIRPGAFAKTIRENDIRGLVNHDENFVLGRNKAKTLSLREDDKGLATTIVPPATTWANDLLVSMKRGDVSQMSFGFIVNKAEYDFDKDERVLTDVTLFDVSVVTFPAYPTTSAQVRSAFANKGKTPPTSTTGILTIGDANTSSVTIGEANTTGTVPMDSATYVPPEIVAALRSVAFPLEYDGLAAIVEKIVAKKELTEEELRALSAYVPALSVPPAKHTETEPEPARKPLRSDTSKGDRWSELFIRAERIAPSLS